MPQPRRRPSDRVVRQFETDTARVAQAVLAVLDYHTPYVPATDTPQPAVAAAGATRDTTPEERRTS